MSVLLVSPKEKGNTHKVLKYVEKNSDAELLVIGENNPGNLNKYETVILSSGVYGDNLHKNLQQWLEQIDKSELHENVKFYAFLTWIGRGKSDKATIRKIKDLLVKKDLFLEEDSAACFGKLAVIRGGHPDEQDCKKILDWVKLKG